MSALQNHMQNEDITLWMQMHTVSVTMLKVKLLKYQISRHEKLLNEIYYRIQRKTIWVAMPIIKDT